MLILLYSSNSNVVNNVLSFNERLTRSFTCDKEDDGENVMTGSIINTVLQLDRHIRDFTVRAKNRTKFNYNDLCAHDGKECFKDPLLELIQVRPAPWGATKDNRSTQSDTNDFHITS